MVLRKRKDNINDSYPVIPFLYQDWILVNREYWNRASHALNKAFRHPPHKPPRFTIWENGWAGVIDCTRFLRETFTGTPSMTKDVLEYICSQSWILGVTPCDDKHRYQLAGATDSYGILEGGSDIVSFEYIRAKSGHSGAVASLVNDDSAYSWIDPDYASDFSCICHKTQRQLIRDIFYQGLKPGVEINPGGRKHVNLSAFLPHDPRNVMVGRQMTFTTPSLYLRRMWYFANTICYCLPMAL